MNIMVIGKPRIDETLIVDNYYNESDSKNILERDIIPGGISVYVACMLSKWGLNVYYQGITGGEEEGLKVKNKLEEYNVDTKFLEITYEKKVNKNYSVLNKINGKRTEYIYDNNVFTMKHKFDFNPDFIVTDGSDMDGAIGASNNYPNIPIIMLANDTTKEMYNLSKRAKFVIASEEFAIAATKININYNKSKTLVDIMQKLQDLENAKYALNLKDHGTLYVKDRQVKYIPKIEVNVFDEYMQEGAFLGAYAYGIIKNLDLDVTAKLANMAASKVMEKLGNIENILDKDVIYDACSIPRENSTEINQEVQGNTNETILDNSPELNKQLEQQVIEEQSNAPQNVETVFDNMEIPKPEEGSNVQ